MDGALVVAQQARAGPHVLGLAAVDLRRVLDPRAALPDAAGEGIFALGERAFAKAAANQQRVGIYPFDAALALCVKHEAAGDELLCRGVEFAHDGGVFTPVRQRDHALVERGRQAGRALIDPLLAFRFGERVDVDDRLPDRLVGAVAFQRGAAQQPLGVRLVLPEIVQAVRAETDERDAVLAVEDRQRLGLQLRIARVGLESGQRALVLLGDPFQRLGATGLFEPDVGVLFGARHACHRGLLRCCASCRCDGHCESQCDCRDKFQASSPRGNAGTCCAEPEEEMEGDTNKKGEPSARPLVSRMAGSLSPRRARQGR